MFLYQHDTDSQFYFSEEINTHVHAHSHTKIYISLQFTTDFLKAKKSFPT